MRRAHKKLRVNRRIVIRSLRCPFCEGREIRRYPDKIHVKLAYDLQITVGGIRRQVISAPLPATAVWTATGTSFHAAIKDGTSTSTS